MAHNYVDSHVHLDDPRFDTDRDDVIARATAADVRTMIVPATTAADWENLHMLSQRISGVYPAYGLHPMFLREHHMLHLDQLDTWLDRHPAVAVGECGLDFFVDGLDRDSQKIYFERQLHMARDHDLPVIIHARRAVEEVIHAIRDCGGLRGVIHSYAGSAEQARQLADLSFLLGIGGPVTYDRARRLRRLVIELPLSWLLLETDAPDQPDAAHRGERNEPAHLPAIAQCVAQLRDEPVEHIAAVTCANARQLFALPPQIDVPNQYHGEHGNGNVSAVPPNILVDDSGDPSYLGQ